MTEKSRSLYSERLPDGRIGVFQGQRPPPRSGCGPALAPWCLPRLWAWPPALAWQAAQDFPLKNLIRRFASHAAGGLESLVLLGPYPAGYRSHVLMVPPGLSGPSGAGRGPLALEHSYTSIW